MLTIALFAASILGLIAVVIVLFDRVTRSRSGYDLHGIDDQLNKLDKLALRRALLLQELKEIELDFETGKITEADYKIMKQRYQRDWLKVDRAVRDGGITEELLQQVETTLAQRLQGHGDPVLRTPRRDRTLCPQCAAVLPANTTSCLACNPKEASQIA